MDYIVLFETWIILALVFGLLEIFVPGGILLNLAIASLFVAIGVQQQYLETWVTTLTTWFILSSVMMFCAYFITERFMAGDIFIENTDENLDVFGKTVKVVHEIGPGNTPGRVEFQGTTWLALGDGSIIPKGSKAEIVCKDNISLVVNPKKT